KVNVAFAPTKAGHLTATLTFQNGGTPPTPIPVTLGGEAYPAPGFSVIEQNYYFGPLNLGAVSANYNLIVRNYAPIAMALPPLTLGGTNSADFSAVPDSGCSMVPANGGTCSIAIVFSPKATGSRYATLSFESRATN